MSVNQQEFKNVLKIVKNIQNEPSLQRNTIYKKFKNKKIDYEPEPLIPLLKALTDTRCFNEKIFWCHQILDNLKVKNSTQRCRLNGHLAFCYFSIKNYEKCIFYGSKSVKYHGIMWKDYNEDWISSNMISCDMVYTLDHVSSRVLHVMVMSCIELRYYEKAQEIWCQRADLFKIRRDLKQQSYIGMVRAYCDAMECQIGFENYLGAQEMLKRLSPDSPEGSMDINDSKKYMDENDYEAYRPDCKMKREKLNNDLEKYNHQKKVESFYFGLRDVFANHIEKGIYNFQTSQQQFFSLARLCTFKYQILKHIGDKKNAIEWGNLCFDVEIDMMRDFEKLVEYGIVCYNKIRLAQMIEPLIAIAIDLSLYNPAERIRYFKTFFSFLPKLHENSLKEYMDVITTKAIRKNFLSIDNLMPFVEFSIKCFKEDMQNYKKGSVPNKRFMDYERRQIKKIVQKPSKFLFEEVQEIIYEKEPEPDKNLIEKQMEQLISRKNSMMIIDHFNSKLGNQTRVNKQGEVSSIIDAQSKQLEFTFTLKNDVYYTSDESF